MFNKLKRLIFSMRIIISLIFILFITACDNAPSHEDIVLMEGIATEELQRTDNFVESMRAQLEFFGAPGEEAKFYHNSANLVETRRDLLNKQITEALIAYNDTLNNQIRKIEQSRVYSGTVPWSEYDEHLNEHYQQQVLNNFDSLVYYKFLYTTLKKEYALHLSNARMMAH